MLIEDTASLKKQDAEKPRNGGFGNKERWRVQDPESSEDLDSQELLAWELEQEQWAERSDAGILEDPRWQQAFGISRDQSASSFSDDEERQGSFFAGRESPLTTHQSQTMAPSSSFSTSHGGRRFQPTSPSKPYFVDDESQANYSSYQVRSISSQGFHSPNRQRPSPPFQQRPSSPSLSIKSAPLRPSSHSSSPPSVQYRPSSPSPSLNARTSYRSHRSYTLPGDSESGSYRPPSPTSTVRSAPFSSVSPTRSVSPGTYRPISNSNRIQGYKSRSPSGSNSTTNYYEPIPPARPSSSMSGQYMHRAASPPPVRASTSMTGRNYQYRNTHNADTEKYRRLPLSGSWNSYNPHSKNVEADRLEAEFARLENVRREGKGVGYFKAEARDEKNIIHVVDMEENDDEGHQIIHLEDTTSLEEEDNGVKVLSDKPNKSTTTVLKAYGIKDLEAEFEEALQRKEVLMRDCSMEDSDETDDILGDAFIVSSSEDNSCEEQQGEAQNKPTETKNKTSLQRKLERFERRGQHDDTADVSKYPRLQQIRQRRRARLNALMNIRQERAEVWNTLEANWEQMERGLTKPLQETASSSKKRCPDPEGSSTCSDEECDRSERPSSIHHSQAPESGSVPKGRDPERGNLPKTRNVTKKSCTKDTTGHSSDNSAQEGPIDFANPKSTMYEFISASPQKETEKTKNSNEAQRESPSDTDQADADTRGEDPPPSSFGEFISQSMSNILKAVGSKDRDDHPELAENRSETRDEDPSEHIAIKPTEDGPQDDETSTAQGEFTDDEHEQGCVNPLQDFVRKKRPKRYNIRTKHNRGNDVASGGCINVLKNWNCGKGAEAPEYIHPLPTKSTDPHDEYKHHFNNDGQGSGHLEASESSDRDIPGCVNPLAGTKFGYGPSSSKSSKNGQHNDVVNGFFTLVDDLLVNKILNIVDEKVVDDMANRFGFD